MTAEELALPTHHLRACDIADNSVSLCEDHQEKTVQAKRAKQKAISRSTGWLAMGAIWQKSSLRNGLSMGYPPTDKRVSIDKPVGNDPKRTPAGHNKTNDAKNKDNEHTSKQRIDVSRPGDKKDKQTEIGSNKL
jgi:hypothetical protein